MRILWLFLLLAGCTVGPDFVRPKAPAADHYNHGGDPSGLLDQHFEKGALPVENWWKLFGSGKLDEIVREGVSGNLTLKAAQASLSQSRDSLKAGYGIFYPQVSASLNPARQRFSPERFGSSSPGTIFNLVTLSASVSYALDLFGGEHRAIENLQSQVEFQREVLLGTYLSLTSNIVNTAIAAAAYRDEIGFTEQLISLQKEQIAIGEKQVEAGIASYGSVLALKSQLASYEATLPPLRQKLAQSEHLLATLAGHAPSEWRPPRISMKDLVLPEKLPLSLPSDLVRRRPDVLASEAALHGASARIGVATAALYPSFTLTGSFGRNDATFPGLLGSRGNFWNLGANVAAPIFDGGTLSAERQAAVDAYRQSLLDYRQTVLSALSQVADILRALEHDGEAFEAQSRSARASREALHLARISYQAGTVNYLQVLLSDIQYHQAAIGLLDAQAQRLQDTTALFAALGGDWRKPDSLNGGFPR